MYLYTRYTTSVSLHKVHHLCFFTLGTSQMYLFTWYTSYVSLGLTDYFTLGIVTSLNLIQQYSTEKLTLCHILAMAEELHKYMHT